MPEIKWIGSPNFSKGREGHRVLAIVDHIMAGSLSGTDDWFSRKESKVSAHYGVGKNGEIHQYVKDEDSAWAVGLVNHPNWSVYEQQGHANPNLYTISIEHEGYPQDGLTEAQYQSTLWLHKYLEAKHGISVDDNHIIGHNRLDTVNRKECPGPKFPWSRLFHDLGKGDGMQEVQFGSKGTDVEQLQKDLNLTGAHLVVDGDFGPVTLAAVKVFQKNHGLVDDGVVGPLTWAALEKAVTPPTAPPPAPQPEPTPAPATKSDVHDKVLDVWTMDVFEDGFFFDLPIKVADPTVKSVGKLQFDTGAFEILLSKPMADFLQLPNQGAVQVSGVGGNVDAYKSVITVRVGDKNIDMPIVVDPSWNNAGAAVGLFGMKGLIDNHIGVDVDPSAGTITLYDSTGDKKGA